MGDSEEERERVGDSGEERERVGDSGEERGVSGESGIDTKYLVSPLSVLLADDPTSLLAPSSLRGRGEGTGGRRPPRASDWTTAFTVGAGGVR